MERLFEIGELAYLGVSTRQLTSSKDILLKMDNRQKHVRLKTGIRVLQERSGGSDYPNSVICSPDYSGIRGGSLVKMSSVGDQCLGRPF